MYTDGGKLFLKEHSKFHSHAFLREFSLVYILFIPYKIHRKRNAPSERTSTHCSGLFIKSSNIFFSLPIFMNSWDRSKYKITFDYSGMFYVKKLLEIVFIRHFFFLPFSTILRIFFWPNASVLEQDRSFLYRFFGSWYITTRFLRSKLLHNRAKKFFWIIIQIINNIIRPIFEYKRVFFKLYRKGHKPN